jgi:SAM-dependent methyltransferase
VGARRPRSATIDPADKENRVERLNVGCGPDIRPGWVNLDVAPLPGVDVVHDLDVLPLPLEDGRFEVIDCQDVLEHVDLVPVLRELHRVLAPGGRLHVRSPHFTSQMVYIDPTHRRCFSIQTFNFFVRSETTFGDFYFDFHFSAIERARITFHRRRSEPWNWLIEPLVNASTWLQHYYEAVGFSRLFPALNVDLTLVK